MTGIVVSSLIEIESVNENTFAYIIHYIFFSNLRRIQPTPSSGADEPNSSRHLRVRGRPQGSVGQISAGAHGREQARDERVPSPREHKREFARGSGVGRGGARHRRRLQSHPQRRGARYSPLHHFGPAAVAFAVANPGQSPGVVHTATGRPHVAVRDARR